MCIHLFTTKTLILTYVDHDPFSEFTTETLILTCVDHDPFSE